MVRMEWERAQANGGNPSPHGLNCRWYNDGLCSIYSVRPYICRIWGVVKALQCPHGCIPERWLMPHEEQRLRRELQRISPLSDECEAMIDEQLRQFMNSARKR